MSGARRSIDSLKAFMAGSGEAARYEPRPGVTVVGSGKGGVGTSVISSLLALEASRRGERVLLVDGDDVVGSLHMMLGLADPGPGLGALRGGNMEPDALVRPIGPGLALFPGGGGDIDATLSSAPAERRALLRRVSGLYERFSTVIVDGGSRLESVMAACGIGAERLLCVTAADRISLAASYALFKVARGRFQSLPVQLVVNGSEHAEAQDLHDLVRSAARNFLSTDIRFGGAVPQDEKLHGLLRRGVSMTELDAESVALSAVEEMASRMLGERDSAGGRPPLPLIR